MKDNARGLSKPTDASIETESNSGSTTRRRLLGGAAALATIPATAAGEETEDEIIEAGDSGSTDGFDEATGAERIPTGRIRDLWASVDMGEVQDKETEIGVTGYWYDDEPGNVEMTVSTRAAHLHIGLTPDRAREIGKSFLDAANAAEDGR